MFEPEAHHTVAKSVAPVALNNSVTGQLCIPVSFTADQMKAAFKQLDETPEIPTREEIDTEIEMAKRDDKRASVFCPLRNAMCRIDCESYCSPRVDMYSGTLEKHYVTGGYCTASVLHARI